MTRRRLLAIACFTTPLLGVAVACTFPSVDYQSDDSAAHADTGAGTSDGSSDAGPSFQDGTLTERNDATALIDAASCIGKCDCDDDHYWIDASCDASSADPTKRLGFGDCDDTDNVRHPGAIPQGLVPPPGKDGDWNCDGKVTLGTTVGVKCEGSPIFCTNTAPGFRDDPGCGGKSDYYTCNSLTCAFTPGSTGVTQTCQ